MSDQLRARYLSLGDNNDEQKFLLKNYYLDVYTFNRKLVDFRADKRYREANAAFSETQATFYKNMKNIDEIFEATKKRINNVEGDVKELRDDVDTLQKDMTNTNSRLDEHDEEINNLREQQEQLSFS